MADNGFLQVFRQFFYQISAYFQIVGMGRSLVGFVYFGRPSLGSAGCFSTAC
jgi:hypothetical protein